MSHAVFSIVVPIDAGRADALELSLASPGTRTDLDEIFHTIPAVHFASFTVFHGREVVEVPGQLGRWLGRSTRRMRFAPVLVFESCIDGTIDDYLDALAHTASKTLLAIFAETTTKAPANAGALRAFLKGHIRRPQLWHVGYPWLRTGHVTAGAELRGALEAALDDVVRTGRSSDPADRLHAHLRRRMDVPPSAKDHWHFIRSVADPRAWSWYSDPVVRWRWRLRYWTAATLGIAVPVLGLLAAIGWICQTYGLRPLVLVLIGLGAALSGAWRWLMGRHPPVPVPDDHLRGLQSLEDVTILNHMTSLILLKRGWLRRVSVRIVLGFLNLIYRTWFTDVTPGRVAGLSTIQMAQWSVVPLDAVDETGASSRRDGLMFLSNYHSSWDGYLDDFIAHALNGVIAIWGNAIGFPAPVTARGFKAFARASMSRWQYWYRRYPHLSVPKIDANDVIRRGLLAPTMAADEARLWLTRFGSVKSGHEVFPALRESVEWSDIQGLVVTGYRHLPHAAYVLLHIRDARAVGEWLTTHWRDLGDARARRTPEIAGDVYRVNVAFTHQGLAAMGLPAAVQAGFPLVFRDGMAPDGDDHHRSRILGDVGASAPSGWGWGAGQSPDGTPRDPVHLLVMLFARSDLDGIFDRLVQPLIRTQAASLLGCLRSHMAGTDDLHQEPFGFVDGISQPVIEGSFAAAKAGADHSLHLVKPGEFVLGYADGEGAVTPGVAVDDAHDGEGLLPYGIGPSSARDFGRNGSFLVLRQLEQDVNAFDRHLGSATASGEAMAAHMVGRWRDGTPLAPGHDDVPRANRFRYTEDPHGFACPTGAHMRRANPRDSLMSDPRRALEAANRHRLIRRGRPYYDVDTNGLPPARAQHARDKGTVFVCLNADLERQFEFVQQNWLLHPSFGGLYDEQDPVLGATGTMTLQHDAVRERVPTAGQIVTVRGGVYAFLPGMRALRYLAYTATRQAPESAFPVEDTPVSMPHPATGPSRVRRALVAVDGLGRALQTAWAVRFPLLVAAALTLLALAPRLTPALGTTLFLASWWGVALVATLASLTAFVVMVTMRLILIYGVRIGLERPRWQGRARWRHLLGFQLLALPVVVSTVHQCAWDAVGETWTEPYWTQVMDLVPAVLLGGGIALVLLVVASSLQALQPGSRPELFVPTTPMSRRLARPDGRPRLLRALSRGLAALGARLVDTVPRNIGEGYIDYRARHLLPGHLFAAALAVLVLAGYASGYLLLNPAWSDWAGRVPPVAYLLVLLMLLGWWLAAAGFFLDRYRVPTLLIIIGWLALVANLAHTDHVFAVGERRVVEPLPPSTVVQSAAPARPDEGLVIVTAEGLGLVSSAWTAEVLTALSAEFGDRFTRALRLASVSSGASLGVAAFLHEYTPTGFPHDDREWRRRVRQRARTPGSGEGAWGLVYPDYVRTFAPLLVPAHLDRGWAIEQAWHRAMGGVRPTLGEWRKGVRAGWRPAMALGATLVESGQRAVLATYDSTSAHGDATGGHDLPVLTAARLAASFPYVSPMARPDVDDPRARFHITDGGFWDNYGAVEAIEWLRAARGAIGARPVLWIEVRSTPTGGIEPPDARSWAFGIVGPWQALSAVRLDAQRTRNVLERQVLQDGWGAGSLSHVTFVLGDQRPRLTWNLGARDITTVERAWSSPENRTGLARVRDFLGAP